MYLEPNNPSLSFANFLDAAIRDKAEIKPFPYTLEVCRCRYCSYCQNGKCALKRCCCMSERVKAKSCTFAELLRDCFANFKDNVFQFRLRIACERASELKTCFLDEGHKAERDASFGSEVRFAREVCLRHEIRNTSLHCDRREQHHCA